MRHCLMLCLLVFPNLIFPQLCSFEFEPKTNEDYVQMNRILAEEFAPQFLQQVDPQYEDAAIPGFCTEMGYDPFGIRDLITAFDWDGDWDMLNNWENMYCLLHEDIDVFELVTREELKPYIYYMVTWLECEWVISYTFFHPVDWNDCGVIYDPFDKHENDTEAAIVYVSRETCDVQRLTTIFHNTTKTTTTPMFASPNHVQVEIDDETHSAVPLGIPANGHLLESGCHTGFDFHVTYSYADGAPPSIDYTDDINNRTGLYELVDVFEPGGLWSRRNDPQTIVEGGKLAGDNGAGNAKARAPWDWPFLDLKTPCSSGISSSECEYIEFDPFEECGYSITDNCAVEGERLRLTVDEDMTMNKYDLFYRDILVKSGVNLRIENSSLKFSGALYLEKGASLIVDNSNLEGCGDPQYYEWEGIKVLKSSVSTEENASTDIIIRNNSKIADAQNGISVSNSANTNTVANILIEDSEILNTYQGLSLVQNSNNAADINLEVSNARISVNKTGIRLDGVKNANITKSTFTGSTTEAIRLVESFCTILDDNTFSDNLNGIFAMGSHPLSGGFQVGNFDQPHNTFEKNAISIATFGLDFPSGANIINNLIDDTYSPVSPDGISPAIVLIGANKSDIVNNSFVYNSIGSYSFSCGDEFNQTSCNEFDIVYSNDIHIIGDNKKTSVLQNSFNNHQLAAFSNVKLEAAQIRSQQGNSNGPAGNCFNGGDVKRFSTDNLTEEFTYYFFGDENEDNCQYPGVDDKIDPQFTNQQPLNCFEDQIGIFNLTTGGNDPSSFIPQILPPTLEPNDECTGCILTAINDIINRVILDGGDNPYTELDDSQDGYSDLNEELMDDWINYGLYIAMVSDDYTFAEQILLPLKAWKWQAKLFGIYVLNNELNKADALLEGLPERDLNEISFKEVQRINLKRFNSLNNSYTMTASEDQNLETIALSNVPSSGYARGLYYILTGIDLPMNFPLSDSRIDVRGNEINAVPAIELFPNPASEYVEIHSVTDIQINRINIVALDGNSILEKRIDSKIYHLNISNFKTGVYIIQATLANGDIFVKKLVIQN